MIVASVTFYNVVVWIHVLAVVVAFDAGQIVKRRALARRNDRRTNHLVQTTNCGKQFVGMGNHWRSPALCL